MVAVDAEPDADVALFAALVADVEAAEAEVLALDAEVLAEDAEEDALVA